MKTVSATTFQVALLVGFAGLFWLFNQSLFDTTWFGVGLALGMAFLLFDQAWLYRYYAEPEVQTKNAITPLITRSILFLLVYVPLSLFVVTSSGSLIGVGMILGIGASLAAELWVWRKDPHAFHQRFLSQLQRELSLSEIDVIVGGFFCLVVFLAYLILW